MRSLLTLALGGLRHRPGRAALTAGVAAVGVALMVALQGAVAAFRHALVPPYAGPEAGADWAVAGQGYRPLSPAVVAAVTARPEVAWALPRSQVVQVVLGGGESEAYLYAIDPQAEAAAGLLRLVEGRLPGPEEPGVALRAEIARRAGLRVGQKVVLYRQGQRYDLPLVGLMGPEGVGGAYWGVGVVIHREQAARLGLADPQPLELLVKLRPGAPADWDRQLPGP